MLKQRHRLFVTLFGVADAVAVAAASFAAVLVRHAVFPAEPWPAGAIGWVRAALIAVSVPVTVATLAALGLYKPRREGSLFGEFWLVCRAGLVSVGTIVVTLWAIGSGLLQAPLPPGSPTPIVLGVAITDPARLQLGALAVLIPGLVGVQRLGLRLVLRAMRRRGRNLRHVAIVGTGRLGQIAHRTLTRNAWTGLGVAYFISHHAQTQRTECQGVPVVGGLADLDAIIDARPVDAVYVALPGSMGGELAGLLRRLERHAVDVRVIPDVQPRYLPVSMAVSELEGMPILSYRESPLSGPGGVLKRAIDIVGACIALCIFAPVMLAAAIAVRLDSPGPIIFRQTRISLGGESFQIYKFRTMRHLADETGLPAWTARDDDRVTRVGRWLRKTSLDELPQLFNVLRGDMALVGPRPERPELIDRFRDDWRGYMLRQHVKAGMTGWAQVHGFRGDTSLRKRLQYDLFYIRNWSIWLDLRILGLTLIRGFVHPNAM
ncbi:MAG: undecaprenyl-phosphate glucose phosphotransferase [Planctomycetota bacterium]|nr:MAG: undecaprenyl-phosphate glucose phosphotransferase [Planctomycetota bacterium]